MNHKSYVKKLENVIGKFMAPVKDIPFSVAIRALSGCKVLSFDKKSFLDRELLKLITSAAKTAGGSAFKDGIYTSRPNEAGNKIEPFVKKALHDLGLKAETPVTKSGKRKATGYPDIEITDKHDRTIYLECKTYNLKNVDTTQRAFYFSPSENFKVTKDALHFMLSFQIEKERRFGKTAYVPKHWRLYTLENLVVDVKHEFNQSNRKLYGSKSDPKSLLAESAV